jgi:histidine triad (HIT) family protein
LTLPADPHCIFCQIVAGDAPSTKVYEDDLVFAFLDIYPWAKGHCLVISKGHYSSIFEISEDAVVAVAKAARRLAPAIRSALNAEGLNLLQSNGEAAWQTVKHFHVHLIPRWSGDGLTPPGTSSQADLDLNAELATKIGEKLT